VPRLRGAPFLLFRHGHHFFDGFVGAVAEEGDAEPAFFVVVVGTPVTGELDGSAHFLEDLEIVIQAAFGDADPVGAVGRFAGCFEMDEIVEPDKAVQ
jgi:hypothetical protein